MAKIRGAVVVDIEKCKGCGLCIVSCPSGVLELAKEVNKKSYHYSYMENAENCTGCCSCSLVCPDVVITVYREKRKKKTES